MKVAPLIVCLLCILCFSCNEVDPKGEEDIHAFVQKWNKNHTQLKAPFLQQDYMDVVEYYGKERTKAELRQDKLVLFEQFPDYTQQLLNDQVTITKENGLYLVVFTNQVEYKGVEATYEYYLSLILKNGTYKIVREGVAEDAKNQDAAIFPKFREATIAKSRNRQLFGDFNGDGLSDYAYVTSPILLTEAEKNNQTASDSLCKGDCDSVINFSAPGLSPITIANAYQSQLENLKDLNGDSADEIGFWNIKPTQKSLYIFDATNSKLLTPPVTINTAVHKNLDLIDVVKKTGPGKITVTRSVERNGNWVLESSIVVLE
tara:strand:- start:6697 stop:7647 length:951 start_codon:yes stop_codon:yes gene_type:complete